MKFIDEAKIKILSGNGGNGIVSFRREKFRPFGGPDGGNGGKGGDIFAIADRNMNTLFPFNYTRIYKALNGENGHSADCYGKAAQDMYLHMPIGTIILNSKTEEHIGDLTTHNQIILLTKGGAGGFGNVHFKTSTNRIPRKSTNGKFGGYLELRLELKILADVGLLGAPNSGKSTFITAISNAHPKISDYPFTTLYPHLGVVTCDYKKPFTVADIPGLIKKASDGKGLGTQFLRHLQRTHLLLHIIDFSQYNNIMNLVNEANEIVYELKKYDLSLFHKPRWLVLNKIDLVPYEERNTKIKHFIKELNWCKPFFVISAITSKNCNQLVKKIFNYFNE